MSVRCRHCVCHVIRIHYITTRQIEYKTANSEWCKLHNLDEDTEWKKLINHTTMIKQNSICPGISVFINNCFKRN